MIGNYCLNNQLDIVEVNEENEINFSTIKEGYHKLTSSPNLPKQLHLLVDARANGLKINVNEIPEIVHIAGKVVKYFEVCKEAILLKQPKDTALATLLSIGLQQLNYQFKVFSTREAAIDWLQQ